MFVVAIRSGGKILEESHAFSDVVVFTSTHPSAPVSVGRERRKTKREGRIVLFCAGILEHSKGARNRVVIGLSNRPARLHRLAESFLGINSWAP
jgi:hypothetical protein